MRQVLSRQDPKLTGSFFSFPFLNRREYVASFPQGVLAARFSASTPGSLNMVVSMDRESNFSTSASATLDNYTVTLTGTSGQSVDEDPILWTGQARFQVTSGT